MTDIICSSKGCLNNRKGKCTAQHIKLNRVCEDFISADCAASKRNTNALQKERGRWKRKAGDVLK